MIVVVSDTSPVRCLHHLRILPVLGDLYDRVLIPPAVESELLSPPQQFESVDLAIYPFVDLKSPKDSLRLRTFLQSLDAGESEAMALAIEVGANAILIDELAGREAARQNGIRPIGTLGILLDAKEMGRVRAIRPLLERLSNELGFFLSEDLKRDAYRLAGE